MLIMSLASCPTLLWTDPFQCLGKANTAAAYYELTFTLFTRTILKNIFPFVNFHLSAELIYG